jgi:hypothetical protein
VAGSRVVMVVKKNFCMKFFVGGNVEEAVDQEEAILVFAFQEGYFGVTIGFRA